MSRTFKDQKESKIRRRPIEPQLRASFLRLKRHGHIEESCSDVCPDCGAEMIYERGYFSCQECNWGAYYPEEEEIRAELEFSDVA